MTALRARLPDGRWHFQHGPIDVVIGADGDSRAVEAAHEAAWRRFETILAELVAFDTSDSYTSASCAPILP